MINDKKKRKERECTVILKCGTLSTRLSPLVVRVRGVIGKGYSRVI